MKKVLLLCVAILLVSVVLGGGACAFDRSAPQYHGDPISITADFRWDEDLNNRWVYIYVTITNNTNKGILNVKSSCNVYCWGEDETDFRTYPQSQGSEFFGNPFPGFFAKLKGPEIKAFSSKTFRVCLLQDRSYDPNTDTYYFLEAMRCTLSVYSIEFENYGILDIADNPLLYSFESHRPKV